MLVKGNFDENGKLKEWRTPTERILLEGVIEPNKEYDVEYISVRHGLRYLWIDGIEEAFSPSSFIAVDFDMDFAFEFYQTVTLSFNDLKDLLNREKDINKNMSLKLFIKDIHKTAVEHGFWDKEKSFGDALALMHSELSEALEFERNKNNLAKGNIDYQHHYTGKISAEEIKKAFNLPDDVFVEAAQVLSNNPTDLCKKPDGLLPELADAVIRIFDYVGKVGKIDEFIEYMSEKHAFNKTRPYMHGGKTL